MKKWSEKYCKTTKWLDSWRRSYTNNFMYTNRQFDIHIQTGEHELGIEYLAATVAAR